jgi:hypothetical protein
VPVTRTRSPRRGSHDRFTCLEMERFAAGGLAEKHSFSLEATARDRTALVERDDEVPARRREDARLWLATVPVVLGAELRGYSAESRISAFSRSGGVP